MRLQFKHFWTFVLYVSLSIANIISVYFRYNLRLTSGKTKEEVTGTKPFDLMLIKQIAISL